MRRIASTWGIRFRRPARSYGRRGVSLTVKLLILAVITFIILIIAFNAAVNSAKPMIKMLAEAEVREYVLTAVNTAVRDELSEEGTKYESLVSLSRNDNGEVTSLVTDMAKINNLQAGVSSRVAKQVVNLVNTDLEIHLGDVTNNLILSGRGPRLPCRVQSVTSVDARALNEFGDAGINQTHHRITLSVTVEVYILMPGGVSSLAVTNDITVAESIIVGKVPGIYSG